MPQTNTNPLKNAKPAPPLKPSRISARDVLQGGAGIGAAEVINQLLAFARNIIFARLISPNDFGIAATFATTLSIFELMSSFSLDKKLIQARGNVDRLQASTQFIELVRTSIVGFLILLSAKSLATLFGIPETTWAFRLLAVSLFTRGFIHMDMYSKQREMSYRSIIKVQIYSGLATTLAALPLAFLRRDYSAMLFVILIRSLSEVTASHLVAEKRYSVGIDRTALKQVWKFGWPLLLNGGLLFILLQGDRFIIAAGPKLFPKNNYTMVDVAMYAIASGFSLIPIALVSKVCISVLMPYLSEVQGEPTQLSKRYHISMAVVSLIAFSLAIFLSVLGGWAITLTYGAKYNSAHVLIGWLGIAQAFRLLRIVPTTVFLAVGKTKVVLFNNIVRATTFLFTCAVAAVGGPLQWIAISTLLGEFLSLMACGYYIKAITHSQTSELFRFSAIVATLPLIASFFDNTLLASQTSFLRVFLFLALFIVGSSILFLKHPILRRYAFSFGSTSRTWLRCRLYGRI